MDYSRRGFTSRLGVLVAGALAEDAAARPSAWTGASSPRAAQQDDHAHQPQPTPAAGSTENKLAVSEGVWEKLMAGNHRFVEGNPLRRDTVSRRQMVLAGQQPEVVVLGCSDSRTTPSLVFDQGLGDLFEIRTAGNVADALALGTIEYALEHLPIRVLVILGHEKCGAVAAAASGQKMKTANLQAIVDKIAPATAKVKGDPKSQEFLRAAEEANVLQCAVDLVASSSIVLRETAAKNVEIIKAVYSLQTGDFGHPRAGDDAGMLASVKEDVLVDLVRVDPHVLPAAPQDDLGDALELLLGGDAARRVRGKTEVDQLGPLERSGASSSPVRLKPFCSSR